MVLNKLMLLLFCSLPSHTFGENHSFFWIACVRHILIGGKQVMFFTSAPAVVVALQRNRFIPLDEKQEKENDNTQRRYPMHHKFILHDKLHLAFPSLLISHYK